MLLGVAFGVELGILLGVELAVLLGVALEVLLRFKAGLHKKVQLTSKIDLFIFRLN